jgi:flagellar protein FliS
MIQNSLRNRYQDASVVTASPARLLVMLYERLCRDLVEAEAGIERRDIEATSRALVHAQDIVSELQLSLDHDRWEGAGQLDRIYTFLLEQLVRANVGKDRAAVASCRRIVEPLRDAWVDAAAATATPAPGTGAGLGAAAGFGALRG